MKTGNGVAVGILRPTPWRRSCRGGWSRRLPGGVKVAVFRAGRFWYWSATDGATARYSPAFTTEDEAFGAALEVS